MNAIRVVYININVTQYIIFVLDNLLLKAIIKFSTSEPGWQYITPKLKILHEFCVRNL